LAAHDCGTVPNLEATLENITPSPAKVFTPNPESSKIYTELFEWYKKLSQDFSKQGESVELSYCMKGLLRFKQF
jgi:sugar (pentulose or hexulose) kinase